MIEEHRIEVVEEESFDEGSPAAYAYLLEDVLEVVLDGVLGDVERSGDLLGGSSAYDELDYLLFPRT